ncbi:permease prefix domain 1-containing protein [Alloacidobacterium dinghuense]|uniref:permease prefix domain 1-containing protein n=1 Tax=Alloacidobacterium dinghuense TaxID=2763107 RepID=UPI002036E9AF|nr:permease prefix domain 1-containing protein [Alloacidobacterium dinghuense]
MNIGKFFTRRGRDAEFALEIEAHIVLEIDENIARGLSRKKPAVKRTSSSAARDKFGSPRRVREEEWEFNTLHFFDDFWRDFRYSTRTLWRGA